MRYTGVTARGIKTPIFKQGDNLIKGICDSILMASSNENFFINDGDIIGVTEAVVARAQGNYASCEQIATDIRSKFGFGDIGIVFPIMSRNRFAIVLKAISMAARKVYVQFSYPSDEVGNLLVSYDALAESGVNPYSDDFCEKEFKEIFKDTTHIFTKVDYIEYYKSLGSNIEIIFSNNPRYVLNYTNNVLNCDIHSRKRTKKVLKDAGAKVFGLDDIMTSSVDGSGYNDDYGLLGANKATENLVKLFPRDTMTFVNDLQNIFYQKTNKNVEVLVYGDGGFKDPVGGIWELADPVISPAFTKGLLGTPNELKMKYFADNEFATLSGESLSKAISEKIKSKDADLKGNMNSQGTTPRYFSDLVGSLCDLISGSGDRGTPVVLIQGYFTNYSSE